MPLVVHVHHVRRHVIEVVVDGSDLEPPAEEAGYHGLHFLIEQDEIAHDHRLVSHLLERRVRSEGEPSLHRDTPNGDGEIGPGHPDPEDLAGLNLARLAELPLHCLPVGVCGACHYRRAHNRDKTENNYRRVQYPKSHGQDLPLHLPLLNRTVLPICSIEVSPYGDLLDEQKGSAAGRAAQGRAGRTHHECARSESAEVERTAVPTTEEALPGGRRPRPAPRPARAAR